MAEIIVIAEHRNGELREITFQMLSKASELAKDQTYDLTVVLLGGNTENMAAQLKDRAARVVAYNDERLQHFDVEYYRDTLAGLITERKPFMVLMGHTPWGMDLAPALAVKTGFPLATDCVDILMESGKPKVIRQIYSGKIFARMAFRNAPSYLITVRGGAFPVSDSCGYQAEIIHASMPSLSAKSRREFLGYQDTSKGEVDITQADLLVSVGRGVGEQENIPNVKQLADLMGGTLSCSRPVVDKKWLPKYHQVGTSGKTVKPKVYLALGISGAFQHVAGINGAGTIIAVNRDKKAPIFRVADYGVTADLLSIVAALKEKVAKK